MKAKFFATAGAFRIWLKRNHTKDDELLVGFYKRDSGRPSMTWPESVDQALCYGWIDGVRRRVDDVSYTIRFTPRRSTSTWSTVNIKRVAELTKLGLMEMPGLEAFARRSVRKSGIYSYERRHDVTLAPHHQARIEADKEAWAYFQQLAPSYRYLLLYHIVSAKKEETRIKRIERLVAAWAEGRRGF